MTKHARDLMDWIREHGGLNVRYVDSGRGIHARVLFDHGGETHAVLVSRGSGSTDWHAWWNTLARLRRILDVERVKSRRPKRRRRQQEPREKRATIPQLTVLPSGFDALANHRHREIVRWLRLNRAWLGLWRDSMRRAGGRSVL